MNAFFDANGVLTPPVHDEFAPLPCDEKLSSTNNQIPTDSSPKQPSDKDPFYPLCEAVVKSPAQSAATPSRKRKEPASSEEDKGDSEPEQKRRRALPKKKKAAPKRERASLSDRLQKDKDRTKRAMEKIKFTSDVMMKRIDNHYDGMQCQSLPAFVFLERTYLESYESHSKDGEMYFVTQDTKDLLREEVKKSKEPIDLDSNYIRRINKTCFKMSEKAFEEHQEAIKQYSEDKAEEDGKKLYIRLKGIWIMGKKQGMDNKILGPLLEFHICKPDEILDLCEETPEVNTI